jgi:hypothetical protein
MNPGYHVWSMFPLAHLTINGMAGGTANGVALTTGAGAIPAAVRPLNRIHVPIWVQLDAAGAWGELTIDTDGTVKFYATPDEGVMTTDAVVETGDVHASWNIVAY